MKRLAGILAAVLVAVIALFSLFVALLPRAAVKAEIGQQIAGWTGREVSVLGEPEIQLFPSLSVTLKDVKVSGPDGMADAEVISMDRLTGTVRLAPLIIGRVEIDTFTIERPLVRLIRDETGRRNWAFDAGAAALQLAFAGDVPLGVFRVNGGTILYEDRASGESERFDSVDLTVEWTSVRTPLAVAGSCIWRGEQVALAVDAEAPFGFLNDAVTPVEVRIDSAPVELIFDGEAQDYPLPRLNGSLRLSTASLRRFANWLGDPIGPGSTLGQASIFGAAEWDDGVLSVADAELTLDGNSASGALKIAADPVPDVTGTLAFDTLDLSPYFAGLESTLSRAEDWRSVELPVDWLDAFAADIRLSANAVKLGTLTAGQTAASASLRDGRLEIGVADAELEGGRLSGDLAIAGGRAPAAEAQLRATDVDLASVGPAVGLGQGISGTGSAMIDVTSTGNELGALLIGLNGKGRFEMQGGDLPSFGLAALASEAGVTEEAAPAESGAPVPMDGASMTVRFARGVAWLEQAMMTAPSYVADAQGRIRLHDGALELKGSVGASDPAAGGGGPVPFTVDGTLADPQARPLVLAN